MSAAIWKSYPESEEAGRIARECGISPVTAQILLNRGVSGPDEIARFLRPALSHLEDPERMAGIGPASDRIRQALARKERVLIFGDYDADGVTASALLHKLFILCGMEAEVYLPSRTDEGYGLSPGSVANIIERGPKLVVTVDCGVTSVDEIAALARAGIDTIVTDHHPPGDALPPALAVVNPRRKDCPYPFKELAGVGVAFKLAWEVARRFSRSKRVSAEYKRFLLDSLGLVALGTVADVAPLVGENRVLVSFGLGALSSGVNVGVKSLCQVARVSAPLSATDIAFRLAPRINAAGRMGRADDALALLMEPDETRCAALAAELDRANRERVRVEDGILRDAMSRPEIAADARTVVLGSEDWHAGVVGIVAARVADRTGKPAVIIAFEGDEGRGSARSAAGVDLGAALKECESALLGFGGHAAAAGVRVERTRMDEFAAVFEASVCRQLLAAEPCPDLECDVRVPPERLDLQLVQEIDLMEPFGHGNRKPVLLGRGFELSGEIKPFGADGKHLSMMVGASGRKLRLVGFGYADRRRELEEMAWRPVEVAFELNRSQWAGPAGFELVARGIRPA